MNINSIIPYIAGLFGLIVGSFLNVVILRYGTGQGLGGRSHCPKCNHQLRWYELIPAVSFLIQLGKCRSCKTRISAQYISVELFTAVSFFLSAYFLIQQYSYLLFTKTILLLIPLLVVISLAIAITVYDIRHKLVPLIWFLSMAFFSLIFLGLQYFFGMNYLGFGQYVVTHVLGLIVAIPFLAIWIFSEGKYMGFADVEIIAWIGFFFGLFSGVIAIVTAFYAGAIFALGYVFSKKIQGHSYGSIRKVQVPFAPFLLVAWFIVLLAQTNIISLFSRLFL